MGHLSTGLSGSCHGLLGSHGLCKLAEKGSGKSQRLPFLKMISFRDFSFYEFSTFTVPFVISLGSSKQPSGYGKQR